MPAQSVKRQRVDPAETRPITTVISLVRRAGRLMVEDLVDRLDAAGFAGINAAFHPVFENLDVGGTRLTELAARADMTHQSMGELVAALEQRGYLERRADPTDGRARLVCLTPQGRQFVRRVLQEIREVEASWQHQFDAAGFGNFQAALEAAVLSAESARTSSTAQ